MSRCKCCKWHSVRIRVPWIFHYSPPLFSRSRKKFSPNKCRQQYQAIKRGVHIKHLCCFLGSVGMVSSMFENQAVAIRRTNRVVSDQNVVSVPTLRLLSFPKCRLCCQLRVVFSTKHLFYPAAGYLPIKRWRRSVGWRKNGEITTFACGDTVEKSDVLLEVLYKVDNKSTRGVTVALFSHGPLSSLYIFSLFTGRFKKKTLADSCPSSTTISFLFFFFPFSWPSAAPSPTGVKRRASVTMDLYWWKDAGNLRSSPSFRLTD